MVSKIQKTWLRGAVLGVLIPSALYSLFFLLVQFPIEIVRHALTYALLVALSLLQIPAVEIGRTLSLPIEDGRAAFMMYNLNLFGFAFVLFFWCAMGALIGWLFGILVGKKVDKIK